MNSLIKTIEDLSLNAWPSHQIQIYDGWLLRFSYFYTHRTNSVEQIGASTLPIQEKLSYTEDIYRQWGTPCIFKISPLVDPAFDRMLDENNYVVEHITHNMVLNFDRSDFFPVTAPVDVSRYIPSSWIEDLFNLKGTTNVMHRQVVPSMYRAIPKETICVSIREDGKTIGTGLGILDRDYVGVYAIHVHPAYRGRHYAKSIVSAILNEGRSSGAKCAYLQVVEGNAAAIALYRSLGFRYVYRDFFRVRRLF
jgi:ribosomal protein S18 acetylase RimI-like enzyme